MSPGFPESMRKLHEPCGARLVADVAHALLRAVSRLGSALQRDPFQWSSAEPPRKAAASQDWLPHVPPQIAEYSRECRRFERIARRRLPVETAERGDSSKD